MKKSIFIITCMFITTLTSCSKAVTPGIGIIIDLDDVMSVSSNDYTVKEKSNCYIVFANDNTSFKSKGFSNVVSENSAMTCDLFIKEDTLQFYLVSCLNKNTFNYKSMNFDGEDFTIILNEEFSASYNISINVSFAEYSLNQEDSFAIHQYKKEGTNDPVLLETSNLVANGNKTITKVNNCNYVGVEYGTDKEQMFELTDDNVPFYVDNSDDISLSKYTITLQ